LEPESTVLSQLAELRLLLTTPPANITIQNPSFEFVNIYTNSLYYYAKCFPVLFPYGRGCPSDTNSKLKDIKLHGQKMIKIGGGPSGRRFQQTPNYYFTVYNYLMKKRVGGIAMLAQKSHLDGTALPEKIPTVREVNQLIDYLGSTESHLVEPMSAVTGSSVTTANRETNTTTDLTNIKKLIARLVPYSKHAQGTEMGIRHEKRNLMALIPLPVINGEGFWRWFITFAPADLYDNRLYEIISKTYDETRTWSQRQIKVVIITYVSANKPEN
jgi:hypothetical protein